MIHQAVLSYYFQKHKKIFSIIIFFFSLALGFIFLFISPDSSQLTALGYFGLFIAVLTGSMTVFIPSPLFITAFFATKTLNPILITLIASLASTLGESTGYLAGYSTRHFLVPDNTKHYLWYQRVYRGIHLHAFVTLYFVSAIPVLSDFAGLICGHINYPYSKFLFATFLGKATKYAFIAYLGLRTFNS